MKIEEHSSLWIAIQQFPLDDPNAEITFSHKLSAKQNWSPTFTERVVEEYRKFIFLCCISPNGASPSQAVDEAWHLHLTYTKSYWIDLCKNTLNKDIHHHPSQGGDEEDHKHRDWYSETLINYQSVFGSLPPDDIWPPPREIESHLPEPAWVVQNQNIALVIMLLTLPLIVSAYLHRVLFPFALTGPQFLGFFPLLTLSCIICYIILQHDKGRALKQLVIEHFPTDTTVFQTALYLYGKHRALQTAIIDLMRRSLLEVSPDKTFTVHRSRYLRPVNEQNPLIPGFLNEVRYAVGYDDIANEWYNEESLRHPVLQKLYLLAYHKESLFKKFHILLIPFAVGIIRYFQGLFNGKSVSYLFWEIVLMVIITWLVQLYTSRKTMVFKKAAELVKDHPEASTPHDDNVVASYAKGENSITWFADGLILTSIFAAHPILDHTHTRYTGNGSYSSCSSCSGGGGGCSGGGSCGGGCGGGCGGCGS
ncbi:MAG TPA: hypothetical protein VF008_18910 [Niastella sp.]